MNNFSYEEQSFNPHLVTFTFLQNLKNGPLKVAITAAIAYINSQ